MVRGEDAEGRPSVRAHRGPARGLRPRPAPFAVSAGGAGACWIRRAPDYALDVISLVEATLENPRQGAAGSGAQRARRGHGRDEGRRRGIRGAPGAPGRDHLPQAPGGAAEPRRSSCTARSVPWARDFELLPKSGAARHGGDGERLQDLRAAATASRSSEGTLLRYLSDAFRVLVRTAAARSAATSGCADIIAVARLHGAHHRLVAWWTRGRAPASCPRPARPRRRTTPWWPTATAWRCMVRNALFARVRLAALRSHPRAGQPRRGMGLRRARAGTRALDDVLRRAQRDPPSTATRGPPPT